MLHPTFVLGKDIQTVGIDDKGHAGMAHLFNEGNGRGLLCANACLLYNISEPTRQAEISYAVFCLKKKKKRYCIFVAKLTNN